MICGYYGEKMQALQFLALNVVQNKITAKSCKSDKNLPHIFAKHLNRRNYC